MESHPISTRFFWSQLQVVTVPTHTLLTAWGGFFIFSHFRPTLCWQLGADFSLFRFSDPYYAGISKTEYITNRIIRLICIFSLFVTNPYTSPEWFSGQFPHKNENAPGPLPTIGERINREL
jgi:hypothetical protein